MGFFSHAVPENPVPTTYLPPPPSKKEHNKELRIQINGITERDAARIIEELRETIKFHPFAKFIFSCLEEEKE